MIRGLKNTNLDNDKKGVEQKYYEVMHQYIATRLGRPLDRMSVLIFILLFKFSLFSFKVLFFCLFLL